MDFVFQKLFQSETIKLLCEKFNRRNQKFTTSLKYLIESFCYNYITVNYFVLEAQCKGSFT